MKNYLKITLAALLFAGVFTSCDDDTTLPETAPASYSENFGTYLGDPPVYSFDLEDKGWTVFTEAGTKNWFLANHTGAVYMEFNPYGSGESSNIGWLISPAINVDEAKLKRLTFQSAQHHASSLDNKFELFISTDFDGTNVLTAEWEQKIFRVPAYNNATNYDFFNSGVIDLSKYSGEIYIAFRVKGNTSTLSGGFEVDNINVF